MASEGSKSNPFGILGHKKAVPSADDLLSLKLLAENDGEFNYLKEEATLFLKSAMTLLNSSPFLRAKFGGDGIQESAVLAELLKQRADTLNFQLHVDDMSRQLLSKEFSKINMDGLRPKAVPVYAPTGAKVNLPTNILGLRQPYSSDNNAPFPNRMAIGGRELNAYGNMWTDDDARPNPAEWTRQNTIDNAGLGTWRFLAQ
jgi:hypothetical protein